MQNDIITCKGTVEIITEYENGLIENKLINNAVLKTGRNALTSALANNIGSSFDFYISKMLFGDNGTNGGVPKVVDTNRNGLFGVTRASKNVIASIDPVINSQVVFTSVLTSSDANGYTINEMALQMNNGDLYSMATFEGQSKTSSAQITFNWKINLWWKMIKEIKKIIGKPEKEAVEILEKHNYYLRIRKEDGKNFMGDCMFDPQRVNVEIKNGKVINIFGVN